MQLQIREIKEKKIWEDFLLTQKEQRNFLQSWNWGETHQILHHKIFRFGFWEEEKLKGIVLLIRQEAKRGTYLECPGGPVIDWQKAAYFQWFVQVIKEVGLREGCSFVRVRPQILKNEESQKKFRDTGFLKAPMHLHAQDTWILEITKEEEALLREMRKTTRYLIKKAIREKVKVIQSTDEKDVKILYDLQKETAERHDFVPFPLDFFQAHFRAFTKDNQIKIFKAIYQEQILSIAMIIFYAEKAIYHYSASSLAFPKIPASYLVQWEAIKEAKKRNCKIYDFWGVAPEDNPKHRFAGVTLFKKGFGGFAVSYLPAQDLPLRWNYWPIRLFETGRRIWRRL